MDENLVNAFATVELEGFEFTDEQKQFIADLVSRVSNHEITWDEAIKIVKERYDANKSREADNQRTICTRPA